MLIPTAKRERKKERVADHKTMKKKWNNNSNTFF
jgi:hypothetical protein